MSSTKKGFTLAEVLITLGIIGVVAAITLPTLIQNYKKTVWVNQLKVAMSIFENGMKQVLINSGCEGSDLMCTGLFADTIDDNYYNNLDNAVKKVFKSAKTCKGASDDCDYQVSALNFPSWNNSERKEGVGAPFSTKYGTMGEYKSVLPNGMIFYLGNNNCAQTNYPDVSTKIKYRCATFVVDVNGLKMPNTVGRDIFLFIVSQDGILYPHEGVEVEKYFSGPAWETYYASKGSDRTMNCSTTVSSVGYQCASRIMENSWKMDY